MEEADEPLLPFADEPAGLLQPGSDWLLRAPVATEEEQLTIRKLRVKTFRFCFQHPHAHVQML